MECIGFSKNYPWFLHLNFSITSFQILIQISMKINYIIFIESFVNETFRTLACSIVSNSNMFLYLTLNCAI
ncbi:hypothetical protein BpHYR1_042753 [Brachionus plicatilis]|uniref:Uncharacterized protein n=1 Tax=Brachionus plicatilis TaxID=10195 RepID=A0A3M7R8M8_BRAPC|nr:hypothetical protein BpHYR1_042753 [Brachionus plicatilis]